MDNLQVTLQTPAYSLGQSRLLHEVMQFQDSYRANQLHSFSLNRQCSASLITVAELVTQFLADLNRPSVVRFYEGSTLLVQSPDLIITVWDSDPAGNCDPRKSLDRSLAINGYGDVDVHLVRDHLEAKLPEQKVPFLSWEFQTGSGRRSQNVKIDEPKPIHREFYPWLECDAYEYFDRYLNSEASIMVLLGEPGTAKTSMIRSLIWHGNLNAMITYEEALLQTDGMFVDFMTSSYVSLLVVEDADLLLTSREHDGNKIMSKFLNISDGLVKLGHKKIIFTANIMDSKKIDSALLRPGRCFDCMTFRRLSYEEACAAAQVAGISKPKKEKSYTLAELFAEAKGERREYQQQRRVGFAM